MKTERVALFLAGQVALLVLLGYYANGYWPVAALFMVVFFFCFVADMLLLRVAAGTLGRTTVYSPRPWPKVFAVLVAVELAVSVVGGILFPNPPLGAIPVAAIVALIMTLTFGSIGLWLWKKRWALVRLNLATSAYYSTVNSGEKPPPLESAPTILTQRSGLTMIEYTMVGFRVRKAFSKKAPLLLPFDRLREVKVSKASEPARGVAENVGIALILLLYVFSPNIYYVPRGRRRREFWKHYSTMSLAYDEGSEEIRGIDQHTLRSLLDFMKPKASAASYVLPEEGTPSSSAGAGGRSPQEVSSPELQRRRSRLRTGAIVALALVDVLFVPVIVSEAIVGSPGAIGGLLFVLPATGAIIYLLKKPRRPPAAFRAGGGVRCHSCGAEVEEGRVFCPSCGTPLLGRG